MEKKYLQYGYVTILDAIVVKTNIIFMFRVKKYKDQYNQSINVYLACVGEQNIWNSCNKWSKVRTHHYSTQVLLRSCKICYLCFKLKTINIINEYLPDMCWKTNYPKNGHVTTINASVVQHPATYGTHMQTLQTVNALRWLKFWLGRN